MGDLVPDFSTKILLKLFISSWAVREDIPFIRAVRFIPIAMKQRLPAQYLRALDTTVRKSEMFRVPD